MRVGLFQLFKESDSFLSKSLAQILKKNNASDILDHTNKTIILRNQVFGLGFNINRGSDLDSSSCFSVCAKQNSRQPEKRGGVCGRCGFVAPRTAIKPPFFLSVLQGWKMCTGVARRTVKKSEGRRQIRETVVSKPDAGKR